MEITRKIGFLQAVAKHPGGSVSRIRDISGFNWDDMKNIIGDLVDAGLIVLERKSRVNARYPRLTSKGRKVLGDWDRIMEELSE